MRCIYCDKQMDKTSISSILFDEDLLCLQCREKLKIRRKSFYLEDLKVETFFEYDGIFRSLLLQYKECCDEALSDVFLYGLNDYIRMRYFDYRILFVPSTQAKKEKRGFDHLNLLFRNVSLKEIKGLEMKKEMIQEGKNAEERYEMKDNYIYTGEDHKKILIVDDVITTGSSILGVYHAVRGHADKMRGLALANKSKRFHFENKVC